MTNAVKRATVACAVFALALAGFASRSDAVSPITPANRPTPLAGETNGVVSPTRLVRVAPDCIAAREAASSLSRLFTLAREEKVSLGAEQCYRTLADEVKFANQAAQPGNNPACVATVGRASNGTPVGHSYHGWGKAADLTDAGESLTFTTPGYAFMKAHGAGVGWNHPAFAEPGGSTCPEPWHWEWVGDGGQLHLDTIRGDVVGLLPSADDHGYATVTGLGALGVHGNFVSHGSAVNKTISWVMVGATSTPGRGGYWMVAADGGVFTYGNAHFYGSTGNRVLNAPVNGMAPTRSGHGYYLVAWDGGIFTFGDAHFYGSTGAKVLNAPVVGMKRTASGEGYWLVASDGGLFTFGDAPFHGSMGGKHLAQPIVGMARTPSGKGYWMLASDGGVFNFGDAHFYGAAAVFHPTSPAVALVPTRTGRGYWIQLANGTVGAFGDAHDYGSG
ncbi:MAG TPA: M15 family metallopeptidase [Acidimicrobiia bacterium]|jgi:hypothetical protein|nr:M15 family metallopeptidase [Acidimicrobiia bacterium]